MFFGGNQYYPNMNYQVPHYAMPYPNPTSVTNQMPPSNWPTQAIATNAQSISTTALKSSKSYGDILAEMKKEDSASSAASYVLNFRFFNFDSAKWPCIIFYFCKRLENWTKTELRKLIPVPTEYYKKTDLYRAGALV